VPRNTTARFAAVSPLEAIGLAEPDSLRAERENAHAPGPSFK
jgi:hypothetical protein